MVDLKGIGLVKMLLKSGKFNVAYREPDCSETSVTAISLKVPRRSEEIEYF